MWLAITNPQYRYLFPWLTPQYELAYLEYWGKILESQLSLIKSRIAELRR